MKLFEKKFIFTFDDPKSKDSNWYGWNENYLIAGSALCDARKIAPLEQEKVYIGQAEYIKIHIPFTKKMLRIGSIYEISPYALYEE